jgi:hypothetical protein
VSTQAGPAESNKRAERAALLKEFRDLLVERWPRTDSMTTLLGDAGLPESFIAEASRVDDRWQQTLKRIDDEHGLLQLVTAVRKSTNIPEEVVEKLFSLERIKHEEAEELGRQAQAVGTYTRLVERMRFTTDHVKRLRKPEHPDRKVLAQLKDRLNGLYELLDELRAAQQGPTTRPDEIVQASDIEKQTNACTDALQLYMTLLDYARPPGDTVHIGTTEAPGGLGGRANDEIVLLHAKAALRNALIRLGEAGQGS